MRQKQRVFSLFLLSPSSRRAWIEIDLKPCVFDGLGESPSSRRAWIEILISYTKISPNRVALLAEGVERNEVGEGLETLGLCRPPRGGRG